MTRGEGCAGCKAGLWDWKYALWAFRGGVLRMGWLLFGGDWRSIRWLPGLMPTVGDSY